MYFYASEFVDMLNEMRFGKLSPKSIQKFYSLSREIQYEDGLGATELSAIFLSLQSVHLTSFSLQLPSPRGR